MWIVMLLHQAQRKVGPMGHLPVLSPHSCNEADHLLCFTQYEVAKHVSSHKAYKNLNIVILEMSPYIVLLSCKATHH